MRAPGFGEERTELKTEADVAAWLIRHGQQWHREWVDLPDDQRGVVTRSLIRRINASINNGTPRNELHEAISELLGMSLNTLPTPKPPPKKNGRPETRIVTPEQLHSALQSGSTLHEVADKLGLSKKTVWNKIAASPELRAIWDARAPRIDGRSDKTRKERKPKSKPMTTKTMVEDALKKCSRKLPPISGDAQFVNVLIEGALWRIRKIALKSGGLLYVGCDVNLFTLTKDERDQLSGMIELLEQIEKDHQEVGLAADQYS